MDIDKRLQEYDSMFGKCSFEQIDAFLEKTIEQSIQEKDLSAVVTFVNEMIGFCRDTDQREKGIMYCSQLIALLHEMGLEGSVPFATSALNIGNAFRAFGLLQESMECYQTVESIYEENLEQTDLRYASLYNNWGLLYQEMQEYECAVQVLEKALYVVSLYEGTQIEQATTHTNLGATLLRLGKEEQAQEHLRKALSIYEADGGKDFHYSAALSAMGDACYMAGKPEEAVKYYEKAMQELESHVGRTEAYERIAENLKEAKSAIKHFVPNMERCRAFYEQYGAPMIHVLFPEYEHQIAVGLVGEGSDCFGYDDEISADHDYGVGFCMWIPEELEETLHKPLQKAYEELLEQHGLDFEKSDKKNRQRKFRHGVMTIRQFYSYFLNQKEFPQTLEEWLLIPDGALSAVTNGEVFRDDEGSFSAIRKKLKAYYPEEVFRYKLAEELTYFSQYGQYNYARMMGRKDYVTAEISFAEWLKHTMQIVYLLNRTYAPYYKWLRRGIKSLPILPEVGDILDATVDMPRQKTAWEKNTYCAEEVNGEDQIALTIEITAKYLLAELEKQGLLEGEETYLASYAEEILGIQEVYEEKEALVQKIVELEWKQFDGVKNEGGRADCQDDWNTFQIMRKSQYLTWSRELLKSYWNDLMEAEAKGWNLIMEKYARMMESTAPEEYEKLKDSLPKRGEERKALEEGIIQIQVPWMEEFAESYPFMAGNARSIHSSEDTRWNTSYETYLRGELGTYSEQTITLYGQFIVGIAKQGRNLAYLIMENTAKLYGYDSVEEAEEKLKELEK